MELGVNGFFRAERAPHPSLGRHVACVWADRSDRNDPVLPDAAVELVWSGRGLFVRGADTCAHAVDAFPERTFVGIRFRPGAAADVLGLHGPELADARVGVSEVWGLAEMERIESRLLECTSAAQAAALLEEVVSARVRAAPDNAVEAVVSELDRGRTPVRELADRLGLSQRQLLRRCVDALGYGPKTLDRILRFQRFRALAARPRDLGLAELAALAGYSDQAHLTRECRSLADETPASLLVRAHMTVSFKTARAAIQ